MLEVQDKSRVVPFGDDPKLGTVDPTSIPIVNFTKTKPQKHEETHTHFTCDSAFDGVRTTRLRGRF